MTFVRRLVTGEAKALADATVPRDRDVIYSDGLYTGMWGSLRLAADYAATYEEIARRHLWARIAINKLSYAVGRLPLKTYEGDDPQSRQRLRGTTLAQLIDHPNDTKETGTTLGLLTRVAMDLMIYSNAIIVKAQSDETTRPMALQPSCPRYWSVDGDGYYVYDPQNGKGKTKYEPWRVMHFMEVGPGTTGWGVSRLEAARLTLAIEHAAQILGEATFRNGARPGGIINIKGLQSQGKERAELVNRFKEEVMLRFGGPSKAGLPAVLEGDVAWLAMSHNLDDSAVVAHRQLTRQEIAAIYDIPQPAIGILDESNFASVDAFHIMFYQDTLGWPVKVIESAFAAQLIRGVTEWQDQFLEFDLNAVMRGAFTERMAGYNTGINARIFTPDEVRGWENLPPMADTQPEAGQLQFPLNYSVAPSPAGMSANGATPNGA